MDGFAVTITEAVGLGASLALSGICYYFYVKSKTTVDRLDVAPCLSIDSKLKDILSDTPGASLQYAVIEGIVQPVGEPLMSHFQKEVVGVLQKLRLKELTMVWDKIIRKWMDRERVLYERENTVPFVLVGSDETKVRVLCPQQASGKHMEMTHEKFHQVNHGLDDIISYVCGVKEKGRLETEEMLRVGTTLTGVGKLILDTNGSLTLQPPSDGSEYFLTIMDLQTLRGEQETTVVGWKILSILCALAGSAVLLWVGYRYYNHRRVRWNQEKERREFERLLTEVQREEDQVENACVICLVHPRNCVFLDCGHVCCCFSCYQGLANRQCPVCRQDIQRVQPLYHA